MVLAKIRRALVVWLALLTLAALLAGSFGAAAQQQRERRVTAPESGPAATPSATPAPTPAKSAPEPAAKTSRSTSAAPNAPRTIAELQSRIEQIVRQPELEPGIFAVKIVSLDTGQVIYQQNEHKFLRPASNMKLYTVTAALDRLTPDYHFITSVYAKDTPDKNGVIQGDLVIYGRGDPSLAARFNDGDYFRGINDLADRIIAAGVKHVRGDLVGDESYFNGAPQGSGWEWEDLTWSYGAAVSALTINDNSIDLTVKPGAGGGDPVVVTTGPTAPFVTITNHATTMPRGAKSDLRIYRGLGQNNLEISGSLPIGDNGFSGSVAVPDPALAFITMLRDALAKRNVKIEGGLRTVDARSGGSIVPNKLPAMVPSTEPPVIPAPVEIASLQSPPFGVVAAHTLKPSQNLYTEIILRTLGKVAGTDPSRPNEAAGLEVVKSFLMQAGVSENELALNDGSGLSRNDMITADATVQLLTFMSKHRYFETLRNALPIAGVDGTLRTRMRGTPAEGNLRAKTGSLSSVASLSGFVTTASGEHLVFSMMLNNYPDANMLRRDSIDAIGILLASAGGKTQQAKIDP